MVAAIALIALVMAMVFRREVLAAGDGTTNMQAIALGCPGGRRAYLAPAVPHPQRLRWRCFLSPIPAAGYHDSDTGTWTLKIARSIAFLAGAMFSALIGYMGMWLAVRANVRVASAARSNSRDAAMKSPSAPERTSAWPRSDLACSALRSWC